MPALTVLVVPSYYGEDVTAVLTDYSAAGLLDPFVWISDARLGGPSTPATLVRQGRGERVQLQQLLTSERYSRVRIAVLVPVEGEPAQRVSLAAEQSIEQIVRSCAVGARIVLLRALITGGSAAPQPADSTLILEGWHNLLVAPEDSASPGLGAVAWGHLVDPVDIAQRAAPVVAAVAGMWSGVDGTPFDTLEILPGQTVRVVRSFYRRLDSAVVEQRLRTHLFDPAGRLPLPRGGELPVVYVDDVATATQTMARMLWTKHRDVLRGPRLAVPDSAATAISIWTAVRMFCTFMGAALRNAPGAWLSAVKSTVTAAVVGSVQGTVFGNSNSAFAVVANADLANWEEVGRNADTLSAALGGPGPTDQRAHADLSALWTDFVNGALTLADGGRRGAGMEPIGVGSGVGVVANAADVVGGRGEEFRGIPTSLAAVIGCDAVHPADVLGAAEVADRLQRAYQDPAAGLEARSASGALAEWQVVMAKSYAWQASSILADFLGRARGEVASLVSALQSAGADTGDERLRARQRTVGMMLKACTWAVLAVLIATIGAAAVGWVTWTFSLSVAAVMVVLYMLVSLALFLMMQRDLFAEMNLRQTHEEQLQYMHGNLRNALADVSRLSSAYGQLLAWSRVLGAVLRAPFGPAPAGSDPVGQLADGLPRSTQLGVAAPSDEHGAHAVHTIQRNLYALGWLSAPWQDMVSAAAARLREEPEMLLRMPGIGSGSGLDQWSAAVASGLVRAGGADVLWGRVMQMFAQDTQVADALTGQVLVDGYPGPVAAAQFSAGMTEGRGVPAAPFHSALFSNAAMTAGRSSVAIDDAAVVRTGLGYRAVVVQASEGLPPYDFAMFEPPLNFLPGSEGEVTTMLRQSDWTGNPPGQDLVF